MNITIDQNSGYCFGVEFAIQMAEDEIKASKELYCLGDIVHNDMEVKRLHKKGLRVINHEQLKELRDCKVLIRAHGEPPETYLTALKNNIELIDASCPVVLKLQNRVKHAFDNIQKRNGQMVIYGKKGHAEVIGLTGQTNNQAIIISDENDLDKIDYSRPVVLFSQTTKSTKGFYNIKEKIEVRFKEASDLPFEDCVQAHDSICRQVSNREPKMKQFAEVHDVVLFVSGKKSSNGKALFKVCQNHNTRSYFIESSSEVDMKWFNEDDSVGICGATSTPMWLMEEVASSIRKRSKKLVLS
ncbi:MAG: 4-hydroxy-3-methylbut-2-enyl diphosphate reductase [Cytophagales bacterium]|nr:4-hydroxy-3-methylbut-2-enyl diphosphate reductase [Cytophagales bacterium]